MAYPKPTLQQSTLRTYQLCFERIQFIFGSHGLNLIAQNFQRQTPEIYKKLHTYGRVTKRAAKDGITLQNFDLFWTAATRKTYINGCIAYMRTYSRYGLYPEAGYHRAYGIPVSATPMFQLKNAPTTIQPILIGLL